MEHPHQFAALVSQLGVGPQLTRGVLLVDDEPLNLRVLADLLEDRWTIHQAGSGAEALAIAAATPLDVVVTDQRMPGMLGVDLLAELKRRRPDLAGIVVTGFADMVALESAINRAGAFRFLRKPWEPADVIQAVEQAAALVEQGRTIDELVRRLAAQGQELAGSLEAVRRQQQQLLHLERLGTIGRLSAGVAHDLKNVMTGLRAAEDELQALDVAPGLRALLTLGLEHVDSLLRTLQTVRDYSRDGSLELALAPLDARRLVDAAVSICHLDVAFRRRRVLTRLAPDLPAVPADHQKLTQALVNLLRNALEATADGGEVRLLADAADGGALRLSVEDDGPGVPEELLARLFQPFATGRGERGLGMGLYMARLVVEAHGGRITAGAGPAGGARFAVELPAGAPAAGPASNPGGADGAQRAG